jgi:hypothetical protein
MSPDLTTTNVLLGVMAAVSLLEALAIIGLLIAGFLVYRHIMQVVGGIEERQVAPIVTRVTAILEDVKSVTSTVQQETGRIDRLIGWILEGTSRKRTRTHAEEPSGPIM